MPVTGNTVNINGVIMTNGVLSATTYQNIPNFDFTGGTVSGSTNFVGGLTANTMSATTFYGDGSNLTGITGITNFISVTYSELVDMISGSTLSQGSFYFISDFKTCYDRPEYYANGDAKLSGATTYVEGEVNPIIVLATSSNTISSTAYQPAYPNDRIQYDWTWDQTEITLGAAYGRITERIDEYNNRTDYDHRTIEFIRFAIYDKGAKISGLLSAFDCNTGVFIGADTLFLSEVSDGDILFFEWQNGLVGVKVISASTDTELVVVVDPTFTNIAFESSTIPMYKAINQEYYGDYKEAYIGQNIVEDFEIYPTFNLDGTAIHNYIGDYSRFFIEGSLSNSGFLLANNVFYSENSRNYSNTIGDRSYNNNFNYWFSRNTIAGRFYNNVARQNGFYSNTIGEYFNDNKIMTQVYDNIIGVGFNENIIISTFYGNNIGNYFYRNDLYSEFYDNKIGNDFNQNIIGDLGNTDNFEFYGNVIGDGFNDNKIRQDFHNNNIGNLFQNNVVNGSFRRNTIGYNFAYNQNIGSRFNANHIGNDFNNNELIGDYFENNKIGNDFQSNSVSYFFRGNQINNDFYNNTLGDTQYFTWNNLNIDNLTGRTYNTFYNSLYGNGGESVGNVILGKELIMHDIINDEYHIIKFTQWTQSNNGGGFSYERTMVWPNEEPTVYFTKSNYGSEVDIIYSGSVEITRGNNGGIYNAAVESGWNDSVSPENTEWNSIYTESTNGSYFQDNNIGNEFKGNYIRNEFYLNNVGSYVGANHFSGDTGNNSIGSYTHDNDFLGDIYGNKWDTEFSNNVIGQSFRVNNFGELVYNNIIADNFSYNEIGFSFYNNTIGDNFGYGYSESQGNKIGNNFENNNVGEYFYNNIIPDNFSYNEIGNYFQSNTVKTKIENNDFTPNYGNITAFTYVATGSTATDNLYTNMVGTTNSVGVNASFNIEVSGNTVVGVSGNTEGKLFVSGDTILISGTQIGGKVSAVSGVTSDAIGKTGTTGTYPNVFATTTGTGLNISFDISVTDNLVDAIELNNSGDGYIVGEELKILGSIFGGVDGVDDITIVVDSVYSDNITITITGVSPNPSVYEPYTTEIFERKGGAKRLSFYDESDILNITNINE